jgi:hypothetical protein
MPERCPERGLNERRSHLPRNGNIACGESVERKPSDWYENEVARLEKRL